VGDVSLLVGTAAGAYSLDDPAVPVIAGTRINHLGRDDTEWWALDGKGRIHHNGDVVASAPEHVALNCLQIGHDAIWIGATDARLYRLERGDLIEDELFADAPGRDSWYTPWGGPPDVRSMAIDASLGLFINIHVGGILRYDNTGLAPTLDQDADVHQVIAHGSRPGLVLAACARGLAQSDNGHDFSFRGEGLHAPYCRAVATIGETIVVSASTGPRTTQGRLYRADLEAGPFRPCTNGLPEWFSENLDTHCLAVLEGSVYAGLGGIVWRSADDGETWEVVASALPKITCLA
jgi:hypothetical protein